MSNFERVEFEKQILKTGLEIVKEKKPSGKWLVQLVSRGRCYYRASSSDSIDDCMDNLSKQLVIDLERKEMEESLGYSWNL
jgi:hypothetical protein